MFQRSGAVALLAEGVDRNVGVVGDLGSPQVALLAEGVDRNTNITGRLLPFSGLPPRGGGG